MAVMTAFICLSVAGAIFTTTVLYWLVIILFGVFISRDVSPLCLRLEAEMLKPRPCLQVLKDNKLVVSTVAWPHNLLVGLGIIMSSVGAGMQSLVSASQLFKVRVQQPYLG